MQLSCPGRILRPQGVQQGQGLQRGGREERWEGWGPGCQHLEQAGDVAVTGLVQKQGAEDVVEEAGVVPAGPLAVWVEVYLQDLWLHHSPPCEQHK